MDDCYFYYYSSCLKGDACPFRHEPSALGKETVCNFWKQRLCNKAHCPFRHMDVKVDRSTIPCYWETQLTGCRKPHCPFLHQSKSLSSDTENGQPLILPVKSGADSEPVETSIAQSSIPQLSSSFDPLVVNFEEESDNESVPSVSPLKSSRLRNAPKTLEQIRLEKIQAESAAFYNYETQQQFVGRESNLSNRLDIDCRARLREKQNPESRAVGPEKSQDLRAVMLSKRMQAQQEEAKTSTNVENIKVLSIDEIREKRRRKMEEQEKEAQVNPPVRVPKQKITFGSEEETEVKSPPKRKIEVNPPVPENAPSAAAKKIKRAISPVVFDVSEKVKKVKKSKEEKKKKKHKKEKRDADVSRKINVLPTSESKFPNIQITANLTSPTKPTVAVVARKRVISADETAPPDVFKRLKKEPQRKEATEPKRKKPERPLWKPSRLVKTEEPEGEPKPAPVPKARLNVAAPVFTPKIQILSSIIKPATSAESKPVRVIKLKKPTASEPVVEPKPEVEKVAEPSTSKLSIEIPKSPQRSLSQSISIDDEFDLLSPSSNPDDSFLRASDDKILEDIDALLNE
ncbi:zinc finger CCCH domain-containing protein 11A-like [Neocloeon triangulifer]|uniref:zinc finger CCCH domain-containing protein 11A-like n=1 Tax=Neocloeon triangulifer TaxID=2078957 RepID=UPI00286F6A10|nr:zinc finger CCCH domain-containing protein 11A-like [Neocloeon triangulifer]